MADFEWPVDLVPYRVAFYLQPHVGGQESPITRTRKVYGLSAPRWLARLTFRAGDDGVRGQSAFAPRLDALIADLEGGLNRIAFWDFRRPRPRGDQREQAVGSITNGATLEGATTMAWTGHVAHTAAWMPGDYFGGDGRVHMVTGLTPYRTDGTGAVTISFKPPLATDIGEGAAIRIRPTSLFQLVSEDAGQNDTAVGEDTEYTLDFVEDLNGDA
ncbi:MAG: hypothetical protein JWQ03_3113 [Variovorax sp.]|nr:hypothetical protein [Variovorax sp.]